MLILLVKLPSKLLTLTINSTPNIIINIIKHIKIYFISTPLSILLYYVIRVTLPILHRFKFVEKDMLIKKTKIDN